MSCWKRNRQLAIEQEWEATTCRILPTEMEYKEIVARLEKLETIVAHQEAIIPSTERSVEGISLINVDAFVESLLNNEASNLGWIPDMIERRLDRRIVLLALGALRQALSTASVEMAGLQLKLVLVPSEALESVAEETETSDTIHHSKKGAVIDEIVREALHKLFSTTKVTLLGHEIHFDLQ